MKNKKYLNLALNILFFLLATILWIISICIIIKSDKINIIIIPYIIFEIMFVINWCLLFFNMFKLKELKIYLKNQEFYILISIFIINIFILNGLVGAAYHDISLFNNPGILWSIAVFTSTILLVTSYYFVFWKLNLWDEQKNLENTENQ